MALAGSQLAAWRHASRTATAAGPAWTSSCIASSSSSSSSSSSHSSPVRSSRHASAPQHVRAFHSAPVQRQQADVAASSTHRSTISWDRYLQLRTQRRIAGLVTTVPSTALAALASGSYFLTQEIDPTASPLMGIDPVYVYALLTIGCTGLGYLVGPSMGSALWGLLHRKDRPSIDVKDKVFYEHIVRNRVDPSRQTMQNRLPDYYGEKIGSLKDYRQWLRDQATFRRKAAHGVEDDLKGV